jgi:hypothetical protein
MFWTFSGQILSSIIIVREKKVTVNQPTDANIYAGQPEIKVRGGSHGKNGSRAGLREEAGR